MNLRIIVRAGLATALFAAALPALAGAQKEEQLSQSVVSGLAKAIADAPVPANYASRRAQGRHRPRAHGAPRHHPLRIIARRARPADRARGDVPRERLQEIRVL